MEVTKRSVDATDPLPSEKTPTTHWVGGCISYTFGLDDVEKRKNLLLLPEVEQIEEFPRLLWSWFHLHYFIRKLKENYFQLYTFKKVS
jgi:hypothetical protein